MRDPYQVILRPVVTERSTLQVDERNVYTFIVAEEANKHDIARAVETIWDVSVRKVRTMRYPGKARRALLGQMARNWEKGRRPSFKKALVHVAEGDEIPLYDVG